MSTSEHDLQRSKERLEALVASGDLIALRAVVEGLHASDIADVVELLEGSAGSIPQCVVG